MDPLEDGQIADGSTSQTQYDPSFEWPGDGDVEDTSKRSTQPVFRLLVLRTSIIAAPLRVAVLDRYAEVQLGRDVQLAGSSVPRIRLKELEVSKLHATVYFDGARKEWNVVDMGSMHGTFLNTGPVAADSTDAGPRLSQSRAASIPRRLRHSDQLTIGSTTFVVHIHADQRPCQACSISGEEEIPLFPSPKKSSVKRTREAAGLDGSSLSAPIVERDPKRALTSLKKSLLASHESRSSPSASNGRSVEYVDRAARRRLMHPSTPSDGPGISIPSPASSSKPRTPSISHEPTPEPVSLPPVAIASTNIGHRLLQQQGWMPGNSLGKPDEEIESTDRIYLVNPLEAKSTSQRAGLGMKTNLAASDSRSSEVNWRDDGKLRRFESLR